jgi:PAS domain S-box-containing protein
LDLDDLFRDCYFGDFSAESSGLAGEKRKATDALEAGEEPDAKKSVTYAQRVERRERNREHAKRSRLRKKFLLESLQDQIHGLQGEIESLRNIIRKECPDKADQLLETVSGPKGKYTPLPMPSGFGPVKTLIEPDYRLMTALSGSQQNFAISDPSLPDNPIVYVSQGFLELTGYTLNQVLGRNCRFLQGPGTDQNAVDVIRKGIKDGVDTSVCLLNYKADGTPFWNQFFIAALRDAEGNIVNYVGVQCEVSKAVVENQVAEKLAITTTETEDNT